MIVEYIGLGITIAGLVILLFEKRSPGKSCGGWIIVMGMALISTYYNVNKGSLIGTIIFVFVGLLAITECAENYIEQKRKKK